MKRRRDNASMLDVAMTGVRRRLGQILDRVQHFGSRYNVSRKGPKIATIVPVELARLTLLEQERAHTLLRLSMLLQDKPSLVEDEDTAMALANELAEETVGTVSS